MADLDYVPEEVPVRPAATVMLLDDRPELEVLLLHRSARSVFVPDMWVYPGGAVDPDDAGNFAPYCDGLDDPAASRELGIEAGGLAFWVAAIRETFEEAGLVLGSAGGADVDSGSERLVQLRDCLNAGECTFADVVSELDLRLDTSAMHSVAHWVTPLGPPRRYDTRFFVARTPPGQEARHDDDEAVNARWIRPADCLASVAAGDMVLMSPTLRMMQCLAEFDSADQVIRSLGEHPPEERVRVQLGPGESRTLLLPGEEGYVGADESIETGWVRLRAR